MNAIQTLLGMSVIVVVQGCSCDAPPPITNARSAPYEPGTGLHFASSPDEIEEAFPVAPALELPEWISTYEKGDATGEVSPLIRELEAEWVELRKNGKTMWGSENWMKEPAYYKRLSTRQLIHECFERPIIAFELMKYEDANLGLLSARVFHDGFAELLGREDLPEGIMDEFEKTAAVIADPTHDLRTVVRTNLNIEALCILCRLSPILERIKGRETAMLNILVKVLRSYQASLKSYQAKLNSRVSDEKVNESIGYFREPCSVAIMALVFLKQIDPAKYETVAPTIARVRFPKTQRMEDLQAYCEMILSYLEPVEDQQRHNQPSERRR